MRSETGRVDDKRAYHVCYKKIVSQYGVIVTRVRLIMAEKKR